MSDKVQEALRSMRSQDGCLTEKSVAVDASNPPLIKERSKKPWDDDPCRMPRSETLVNPFSEKIFINLYSCCIMVGAHAVGRACLNGAWVKIRSEGYKQFDTGNILAKCIDGHVIGPWDTRSTGTFLIRCKIVFPFQIAISIENQYAGFPGRNGSDLDIFAVVEVGEPIW